MPVMDCRQRRRGMRGVGVWVRAVMVVLFVSVPAVAQTHLLFRDIEYESPGSTRNRLDVVMPNYGPDPGTPTIVYIHGGAWHTRDKGDDLPLYIELTRHGYAVVPCNYTLAASGAPSFPQAVQDVKNVLRWVRMEGPHFNLAPEIVVVGPSAGGHLALMAALTSGNELFETLAPPLGGYRPQAFISIAGFTDLEWHVATYGQQQMFNRFLGTWYNPETVNLYRSASPITHVSPCDPPGALIHGTNDLVVPHHHSVALTEALASRQIFTSLTLVEGGGHSFDPLGGQIGVAQRIAGIIPVLQPFFKTPDLSGDGRLNVDDFLALINLYAAGDRRADINEDGLLNIDDFHAFLNLFVLGC
jgi:acetyl esterase/lipase